MHALSIVLKLKIVKGFTKNSSKNVVPSVFHPHGGGPQPFLGFYANSARTHSSFPSIFAVWNTLFSPYRASSGSDTSTSHCSVSALCILNKIAKPQEKQQQDKGKKCRLGGKGQPRVMREPVRCEAPD